MAVLERAAAALEEEERVPVDAVRVSVEHLVELERDAKRYRCLEWLLDIKWELDDDGERYDLRVRDLPQPPARARNLDDAVDEWDKQRDAWIAEHGDG